MFIDGKINFAVIISQSKIHGKGLYALTTVPAKKKIGTLAGKIISRRAGRIKAKVNESISLVELWNGKTLDASTNSNALKFINHSCRPNTFMRTIHNYVEFYALRDIATNEELTCDYGPTHHDGYKKCNCGAKGCRGFL